MFFCFNFSDRLRTINNMLGDCYAAAVIEKLSQKELHGVHQEVPLEEVVEIEMERKGNC